MHNTIRSMIFCAVAVMLFALSAHGQSVSEIGETVSGFLESKTQSIGTQDMRTDHNIHYRLWGGIGGSGAFAKTTPYSFGGGADFQIYHILFTGAFIHNSAIRRSQPRYGWNEIDGMIGYSTNGRDLIPYGFLPDQLTLSIAAGVGWYNYSTNWRFGRGGRFGGPVPIDTNASHVNTYEWGFGIPIQAQASYAIVRYVGLGVTLFANLNTKKSNYGAMASVVISYF
jgi:hypothetical protein